MNKAVRWIFLALMLLASVSVAQQTVEQPAPPGKTEDQPGQTAEPQQGMGQMQGMELMQNMDKMATTVDPHGGSLRADDEEGDGGHALQARCWH